MGILSRLISLFRRSRGRRKASAHFDEVGVFCRWPDGEEAIVEWSELREVSIQTTDTGPFIEDVYLMLVTDATRCVIPQEAIGFSEILDRLGQLPGFDYQAVISAMKCTDNAIFLCWRRADA